MIQCRARTIVHPIRTAQGASTSLWAIIFLLVIGFVFTGCATTPKAPSLTAVRVARIHGALQHIAESYVHKDMTRLLLYVDPSLPPSLLKDPMEQDFKVFEMTLRMKINRVEIRAQVIQTGVSWEGTWTSSASGSVPLYQTGHALMEWSVDESPRLLAIRGEIPWGIPPMGVSQNG